MLDHNICIKYVNMKKFFSFIFVKFSDIKNFEFIEIGGIMLFSRNLISRIFSSISLAIPLGLVILIINTSIKFFTFIKINSYIYFIPIYVCPLGMIFSILSHKISPNRISVFSFFLNTLLIIAELIFIIIGARYLGH